MKVNVPEFKPKGLATKPEMKVNVEEFKPASSNVAPAMPTNMNLAVNSAQFVPKQPEKPVEPPKEKYVLMIERVVKGSDEEIKVDELDEDEKKRVDEMKEVVD